MADFSLPTLVTTYADFLTQMKQRDEDIIKMLDGTTTSNLPSGAKRWNTSGNKWEKYNGSVWSDLSTLYEIKVRDSDKLNGQAATYYAIASHTHTGYAALNHTHSDYAPVEHNHDTVYLGKSAQASDSAKLTGYAPSMATNPTTIGLRDASGDFYARLFRSTYAEQTSTPAITADICFRNDATNDNYMRFMSSDAFKSWLTSIGVKITDTLPATLPTYDLTLGELNKQLVANGKITFTAADLQAQVLNYSPGNRVEVSFKEGMRTSSKTYVKVGEVIVVGSGTVTVVMTLGTAASGEVGATPNDTYGQIYKNGVATGTERFLKRYSNPVTFSENISVSRGDVLQIYLKCPSGEYQGAMCTSASVRVDVPTSSISVL